MTGVYLVAVTSILLATSCPVDGSTISVNGSTPSGGEVVGDVILVGKYTKMDPILEQYKKLEAMLLELQRMQVGCCQQCGQEPNESGFYQDCQDAYEQGVTVSGVYTIQPDENLPFQVYCDMETDGGGWTVFQCRKDGSVDFYRNWPDYVQGFGDLTGELWLGLDKVHRITSLTSGPEGNEMRVDMGDFEGNTAYAKYGSFAIGDPTAKYTLSVSGYSGTAGDSLSRHSGQKFTTKDEDNDPAGVNCAQEYKGAWWYEVCHDSNLNGLYLRGSHSSYADGVNWRQWKGYYYSLQFTEMKTRRR